MVNNTNELQKASINKINNNIKLNNMNDVQKDISIEEVKKLNIYEKLFGVQQEVKNLFRTENQDKKFMKYTYFGEEQALNLIRPLLGKYRLLLMPSDHPEQFEHKLSDKGLYEVRYLKQVL